MEEVLFAMCSATDTYDIALACQGIDIYKLCLMGMELITMLKKNRFFNNSSIQRF